jgi:hypothetical protein
MIRQHAIFGFIMVVSCLLFSAVKAEDYSQQRTLFKQLYQQALNGQKSGGTKKTRQIERLSHHSLPGLCFTGGRYGSIAHRSYQCPFKKPILTETDTRTINAAPIVSAIISSNKVNASSFFPPLEG